MFIGTAVRIGIFLAVLLTASLWRVFKKAGRPGWPALVPGYNGYLAVKIAGKPGWWILLYLVPLLNIVVAADVSDALARKFGKGTGFGVGLLLLPFIFYPMLADGDAAYAVAGADATGGTTVLGRRGALLSASLIFFFVPTLTGTLALLVALFSRGFSAADGSTALRAFLDVAALIGLVGIWKWRKWGVYLFVLADLMMVVSMLTPLMATPFHRIRVPDLLLFVAGEALLLALFGLGSLASLVAFRRFGGAASGHTGADGPPLTRTPLVHKQMLVPHPGNYAFTPQHFLYFFPEPQGQGSLRPILAPEAGGGPFRQ